jgi:hypothetical protein
MNSDKSNCCEHLLRTSPVRSPFARVVSLGFYDGTTSGVAQCSQCSRSYRYELVAWDSGQDLRVFSLAILPQKSFNEVVKLLSGATGPTWPFWSPALPSDPTVSAALDVELANAETPSCVVVARQMDMELLSGRNLTDDARTKLPAHKGYPDAEGWGFWQTYLGIDSLKEPT